MNILFNETVIFVKVQKLNNKSEIIKMTDSLKKYFASFGKIKSTEYCHEGMTIVQLTCQN
jgi:hypothetical protein